MSTERPLLDVEFAVVGAGLQVDEVGVGVWLEALEPGQQHPTASVLLLLDLVRAVKLLLQDLANLKRPFVVNYSFFKCSISASFSLFSSLQQLTIYMFNITFCR